MKPTVGRTSSSGIIPESRNLDVVGPITKTVADAAVVASVIVGHSLEEGLGMAVTPYYSKLTVLRLSQKHHLNPLSGTSRPCAARGSVCPGRGSGTPRRRRR